jgi:hypothetical protein
MRSLALSLVALAASATAAAAKPATVVVTLSPELQAKAERTYGEKDIQNLALDLQTSVARATARTGAFDDARIVLELADVRPNRPTFKQMADNPSLSYSSFSTGGADIQGHAVMPNGQVVPLSYSYYETDIRLAPLGSTWADAEMTFDRFAERVARGKPVASR